MKKVSVLFAALFIGIIAAHAHTVEWYVDGSVYDTTICSAGDNITPPTPPAKYGYTFAGWKLAYTPIEYIESTGTQYIDTGFAPNQNTRVVMESQIITMSNHDNFIFGTRAETRKEAFCVTILQNKSNYRSDYGSVEAAISINGIWANKLKFDKNKNVLRMYNETGVELGSITNAEQNFQSPGNILLPGGISTYPNVYRFEGTIRIYYFQLYDNGTLVRDMIPVLDYNDVPCMYDKVSGTFFYNAGTGNFVAGPVIDE